MQFPAGATAIRLAAGARTFRESATKKPLTRRELRNPRTEVALRDGEFAAGTNTRIPASLHRLVVAHDAGIDRYRLTVAVRIHAIGAAHTKILMLARAFAVC